MATRMQQRRGTAAQWTSADPVLAAGEIGFEIDTNQFKMGDGVNAWSDLSYFKNLEDLGGSLDDYVLVTSKGQVNGVAELDNTGKIPASQIPALVGLDTEIATAVQNAVTNLVDGAPLALDTLNEISAALADDENFASWVTQTLNNKAPLASPNLAGVPTAPTAAASVNNTQIATTGYVKSQNYLTSVDLVDLNANVSDHTTALGTVDSRLDLIEADVAGLDTGLTGVIGDVSTIDGTLSTTVTTVSSHATTISSIESDVAGLLTSVSTHGGDLGSLDGRLDSAEGSITTLQGSVTTAEGNISTLQADLDTAEATLATTTSNYNAHDAKTTTVHGIADTAALATKTYADTAGTNAVASANTYTDSAITSKAPLASPALTGTPTAPTATVGTNTTQIATTAFVKSEVDAVIAAAPGALNTLDELAAALGDDANFATTVTTNLASKAPLAGPTFTGTVALPAASSVTLNGTALSTTLDTKANKTADISSKSADYTFMSSDVNMIIEHNSGSAATFTIPSDNAFWAVGQRLELIQVSSGRITVAGAAGVTVNGTPGLKTRAQWSGATIIKRAANTFVVIGDLSA